MPTPDAQAHSATAPAVGAGPRRPLPNAEEPSQRGAVHLLCRCVPLAVNPHQRCRAPLLSWPPPVRCGPGRSATRRQRGGAHAHPGQRQQQRRAFHTAQPPAHAPLCAQRPSRHTACSGNTRVLRLRAAGRFVAPEHALLGADRELGESPQARHHSRWEEQCERISRARRCRSPLPADAGRRARDLRPERPTEACGPHTPPRPVGEVADRSARVVGQRGPKHNSNMHKKEET